ncbi:MAG: DMT family transporter [Plesiomonas sp.]|uniref:DMT family transporter n=1 Tax=Plesiomonas sp. TaxID=2486279 RepID=UPI003F375A0C
MTMHTHRPLVGASWMILAGLAFACINTLTQYISIHMRLPSTSVALYQYLVALIAMLPWLLKTGLRRSLHTQHFGQHVFRIFLSVIGIQCWLWALAYPIPIWQGIALLMTSPLFATLGSGLFLGEKVGAARWCATLAGFIGAMIILEPWGNEFKLITLLPLAAAFFWASYSLMVKKLSHHDSSTTMVVYLLLLITPFNLVLAIPEFTLPTLYSGAILLVVGLLTAFAQTAIAKAYASADASFVQPFDNFKLPINIAAGWIVFGWAPPGRLWLGATIIIAATAFITHREHQQSA